MGIVDSDIRDPLKFGADFEKEKLSRSLDNLSQCFSEEEPDISEEEYPIRFEIATPRTAKPSTFKFRRENA